MAVISLKFTIYTKEKKTKHQCGMPEAVEIIKVHKPFALKIEDGPKFAVNPCPLLPTMLLDQTSVFNVEWSLVHVRRRGNLIAVEPTISGEILAKLIPLPTYKIPQKKQTQLGCNPNTILLKVLGV